MLLDDFSLVGQPPELAGRTLRELIGQDYRYREDSAHSPDQVFLLVEGQWWRTFTDGPHLHWQARQEAPRAWESPEDGISALLRDLGRELGLRGEVLNGWSHGVWNSSPALSLNFEDGRQINFFTGDDEIKTFELVHWTFRPQKA